MTSPERRAARYIHEMKRRLILIAEKKSTHLGYCIVMSRLPEREKNIKLIKNDDVRKERLSQFYILKKMLEELDWKSLPSSKKTV